MATATKKPSTTKAAPKKAAPKTTPLREREPKVLLTEAGYAVAALADQAITSAKALPAKADELRTELPAKAKAKAEAMRATGPDKAKALPQTFRSKLAETRTDVEGAVKSYRSKATARFTDLSSKVTGKLDARLAAFEKHFDARVKAGKSVVTEVKTDERVSAVLEQTDAAVAQVKDAVAMVRKTADTAVETSKDQVKAVVGQVKKTADVTVDAIKGDDDAPTAVAS